MLEEKQILIQDGCHNIAPRLGKSTFEVAESYAIGFFDSDLRSNRQSGIPSSHTIKHAFFTSNRCRAA